MFFNSTLKYTAPTQIPGNNQVRELTVITVIFLLTACGQKGALYLPENPNEDQVSQQAASAGMDAETGNEQAKINKR